MSGNNFSEDVKPTRSVLGDVTNLPLKTEFSSALGHLGVKTREGYGKNEAIGDGNLGVAKRVSLGVKDFIENKCKTKIRVTDSSENQACDLLPTNSKVVTSVENILSVASSGLIETKETCNMLDGSVALPQSIEEVSDASRDSFASSGSIPAVSGPCKKDSDYEGKHTFDITQSSLVGQGFVSHVCLCDKKDLPVGKLASNRNESVKWSRLPKSQGCKFFELDWCTPLKGDGCANLNVGTDLLKACSCSFCVKAAYIWSDLHYQDIKGRIAALEKSQKDASILVNNYSRGKQPDIHNHVNSNTTSKLESDLTGRWRFLFHHMEGIFTHESCQLQTSFVTLKDLRDSCKMDLERTNGKLPDMS